MNLLQSLQRKVHKVQPVVVVNLHEFTARELIFVAWCKMNCSSNLSSEVPHISTCRGWRCGHIKPMDMYYEHTHLRGTGDANSFQRK